MLEDFQTGTASMARKRHLASTARGLLCFCLMTLVTTGLIHSIRLIRGRNKPILRRTALQADVWWCVMNPRAVPPVTHGSALQAPERMWGTCDVIAFQAPECILGSGNVIFHPHRTDAIHNTLLPGGQYIE